MATVHFHNETELLQVYHEPQTGLPFTLAPGESRDIVVPDEPYYPFLLANGAQELKRTCLLLRARRSTVLIYLQVGRQRSQFR